MTTQDFRGLLKPQKNRKPVTGSFGLAVSGDCLLFSMNGL